METVNIHQAKTHLSRLIAKAVEGEGFIIAKAGRPLVKVVPVDAPEAVAVRRLGFLEGTLQVPDDFDRMGDETIAAQFEGDS